MLLDPPPVPISAVFDPGPRTWVVTFSGPLQANPGLANANWEICDGELEKDTIGTTTAGGSVVNGTASAFGSDTCLSGAISYSASPADLKGANGAPVVAFTDFPMTIL